MNLSHINIRLLVKDFGACYDFYTQTLGMTTSWGDRNGPFASFSANGKDPCFSIFLAELQTMYKGYTHPQGSGHTDKVVYSIPTDDIDRDYAALSAKGVQFIGDVQTIPEWYMRCVYFRDPEGNLLELCGDIPQ